MPPPALAGVGHIAFRRDITSVRAYVRMCVCAYVTFVTRFKFICKFKCKFTSAFLFYTFWTRKLKLCTYATYLNQDLLMYGTVAPGSCPCGARGRGGGIRVLWTHF